jgi:hypothetical protein
LLPFFSASIRQHLMTNADLLAGSWVTEKNFGANQHD